MTFWRALFYALAVIALVVGGLIILSGAPTKRPYASALAYFAAALALLAFSLSALAAA